MFDHKKVPSIRRIFRAPRGINSEIFRGAFGAAILSYLEDVHIILPQTMVRTPQNLVLGPESTVYLVLVIFPHDFAFYLVACLRIRGHQISWD